MKQPTTRDNGAPRIPKSLFSHLKRRHSLAIGQASTDRVPKPALQLSNEPTAEVCSSRPFLVNKVKGVERGETVDTGPSLDAPHPAEDEGHPLMPRSARTIRVGRRPRARTVAGSCPACEVTCERRSVPAP